MATPVLVTFRIRRDTAANWTSVNPVLKLGEPGLETNTRKVKYGDGVTAWNALAYATAVVAWTDVTGKPAFGTMSTQNANAVAITGGTIAGLTSLTSTVLIQDGADQIMALRNTTNNTHGLAFYGAGVAYDASIKQTPATGELKIDVGRSVGWGGRIVFSTDTVNRWRISNVGNFQPETDNANSIGLSGARVKDIFLGNSPTVTSDKRLKRDIGGIPDEWLDAWADVEWSRYKFTDGERWHVGLVAQQVRDAFAAHGLDAREIGLLCYDEWAAEPAVRAKHNRKGELVREAQPGRKAGNRWGLRYEQCHAMEAAYMRRELKRLAAR